MPSLILHQDRTPRQASSEHQKELPRTRPPHIHQRSLWRPLRHST